MTREEAIKVLEMFLYKQCDLARTKFAYDANTVWEAVNIASKALEQESTTKDEHHKQNIQAYAHDFGVSEEQAEKELRVTTKDNLGVDCISREQALVAIRNLYPGMPRVDFNGSLRKWVDKYKPYIECDDAIKLLPSVTPQEPFKPMVEIDLYSVIKQKYIEREVLDKIRAEIIKYEGDCRLSVDEYPSCKQCTDNVFETIYGILDKYKPESEGKE